MNRSVSPWIAGVLTVGLLLVPRSGHPQFRSFSTSSHNILEGNWQSCREPDGRFSERVYDHVVNGVGQFEVHLGPRHEFAIFRSVQDEHRAHNSPDNFLQPYDVEQQAGRAKQRWEIPALHVAFTVTLAGGSRSDCESWYILLEPLEKASD